MTTRKTTAKICEHLFTLLDSIFRQINRKNRTEYQRTDFFYCQHCLDQREIKKELTLNGTGNVPGWYDARRTYVINDIGV